MQRNFSIGDTPSGVTDSPAKIVGAAMAVRGAGAGGPTVPPHGPEAHTDAGGVEAGPVGEAPVGEVSAEETPWEAMSRKELMGMEKGARKEYMGGLDKSQKKQQVHEMVRGIFGGIGGRGRGSGMFSDIRLKEKIERTGASPSGIPIYEFNYIGDTNRYSGAMAQDLLEMNIDAVSMGGDGYYRVNYNNIDVDMHLIN